MLKHFVKQTPQHLLCDKKGLHCEQPLDLICTNPICRENPIACSVCFDERHKHHNVISFSKFLDEFSRQTRNFDKKSLLPEIERTHRHAKSVCSQLRRNINEKLDEFEKDIDMYSEYLMNELDQKDLIHKLVNLRASPERMSSTINLSELRQSIKFILNNSKFNGEGEMSRISAPLKQENERIQSLISKLEYTTFNCLRRVETELNNLKELRETIGEVKRNQIREVNNSSTPPNKVRVDKHQLTDQSTNIKKGDSSSHQQPQSLTIKPFVVSEKTQHNPQEQSEISHSYHRAKYSFTMKHPDIVLLNNTIKSDVHGRQAHFALATPCVSDFPVSKWMIKILSCRDIHCTNSLAVGICHLSDLKKKHFQARANDFQDGYMLSSSGDILTPGDITKNEGMRFKAGDILEFQYDSFYKLLEIKNQQGNILSLKVEDKGKDSLFICARMTFLGDSVELLNY